MKGVKRELLAECLGTFVLIVFGIASVAQAVLKGNGSADLLPINLAWGLAVTMGVYIAGGISGAHLNPAVTIALAVCKRFPWKKCLPYIAAQFLGAFLASIVVYLVYHEGINAFDGGIRQVVGAKATAGIWATYPQNYLSILGGVIDQVVGTFLLVLVVFSLSDQKNTAPNANLAPLLVGATVVLIGMTFGFNAGYAINPARDLSPRLFTYLFGWGPEVFTASHSFWWVPVVAPIVGAVLGGIAYDFLITQHHPDAESGAQVSEV